MVISQAFTGGGKPHVPLRATEENYRRFVDAFTDKKSC